ncbi:MAG: hypothetical protein U1F47_11185 [Hyphomicrobiales bacterium]|jgi:hypothetical protein
MLEDLLYRINDLFSFVPNAGHMPDHVLPLAILFSLFGALILGRYTGTVGSLTLPLNFSALFIGAMASNWLMRGIQMQVDAQVQRPLLGSLVGMLIAALIMLRWMQGDHRKI